MGFASKIRAISFTASIFGGVSDLRVVFVHYSTTFLCWKSHCWGTCTTNDQFEFCLANCIYGDHPMCGNFSSAGKVVLTMANSEIFASGANSPHYLYLDHEFS